MPQLQFVKLYQKNYKKTSIPLQINYHVAHANNITIYSDSNHVCMLTIQLYLITDLYKGHHRFSAAKFLLAIVPWTREWSVP